MGRSSVATSLAAYYSQKKENVLLVQWALSDSISPLFSAPSATHKGNSVSFSFPPHPQINSFHVMNYNADEAIQEYFVDHLKMKLVYSLIIQNKHVQKLIHAAPGISELFFLGRLFWLIELSQKEIGSSYDRIIVDAPATGHGVSLFGIAKAVANLGMTGPLALECERVSKLLSNPEKTGIIFVTLPEELPVEECIESLPTVKAKLGFPPLCVLVNQSISNFNLSPSESKTNLDEKRSDDNQENWMKILLESFSSETAKSEFKILIHSLLKRNIYEEKCQRFLNTQNIKMIPIPDFNLTQKQNSPFQIIQSMTQYLQNLDNSITMSSK